MEAAFKKYFWVLNLAVLAAVAWLVARTVVDYAATRYLTVKETPETLRSADPSVKILARAHDEGLGQELVSRSPFNVEERKKPTVDKAKCEPKCDGKECGDDGCGGQCGKCTDEQVCKEGKCEAKDEGPQQSELGIKLIGTAVNPTDPDLRWANIEVQGETTMVSPGSDILDGKATVVDILPQIIYLREGDRLTHVGLWSEVVAKTGPAGRTPFRPGVNPPRPLVRPPVGMPPRVSGRPQGFDYSKGVKQISDYEYRIDKQMLDEQLTDLTQLGMQARVIPNYVRGKYEGFKLVGVRPGSLYRAIGIRSGDVVRSINGKKIDSPNKAMELFTQLKTASNIKLEVERRGKVVPFNYLVQ